MDFGILRMKKILFSIIIFFLFVLESESKEEIIGNIDNGKSIFKKNCTTCHSIDLEKKMIGPALSGITEKRNREWLHKWIKNNKLLRNSGDKDAIDIYKKYGNIEMNSFPQLSEKDIDDILFFIKNYKLKLKNENRNEKNSILDQTVKKNEQFIQKLFIFFLSIISVILIWILYRTYILYNLLNNNDSILIFKKIDFILKIIYKNFLKKHKNNWYLFSSFIGILLIINIFCIWNFLMKIDVNKGYEPRQPIYFSHKIHSEINGIDCQYCHSNAKYAKNSGIPSMNICMNCHITIDEYKGNYIEYGKSRNEYNKEINKIYYAIGWNKQKRKYTGKTHPVKWIRIHNMPDFVYFDHSQHIITGKKPIKKFKKVNLICTACHGEVQKMNQVKMNNDFTMEWCISCHRNVKIDTDNKYYKNYFKNNKEYTLDMIGGIECAKCHY
ncbi:c-type cytochrome [Blattabacterium cuenoti]|uniref:c-type cytochrome n=1 Tax=Blattabacterium cuenoti TaxID=1653831 RepID=UPI001EEA66CC|nr:c-type cytochrome [Blattabacterium cuenoti]